MTVPGTKHLGDSTTSGEKTAARFDVAGGYLNI